MTDMVAKITKLFSINGLSNSRILRIAGFVLFLSLYYITISPFLEKHITESISSMARDSSNISINSLSPVFDIHVYAGEYNLTNGFNNQELSSKTKFFTLDPRVLAMNKFLKDYNSPMAKYANVFIESADKNGLDWRLVASISGVESAFGNITPRGSNNAWGWRGINSNEKGWSMFASWDQAIMHITERLAQGYGTDLTPFEIEPTYCPPCAENPQHLWANGVNRFMNQLQYYLDNLENI